jgi:Domain of unknown function (DUF4386)
VKDNSLYELGGICSVLVGLSYVVFGITFILMPPQITGIDNFASPTIILFESNRVLVLTQYWAMTLGAIFALAVIPAVSEKVRNLNEGWLRWTSSLATLGFAVTILDNYWAIVITPAQSAAYMAADAALRAAMTLPSAPQQSDLKGWLGYGAVGLWILVVNLLALRGNRWPKGLAYLGIVVAIIYFIAVIPAGILGDLSLVVAGVGGVVLAPIWYIWMGVNLRRKGAQGNTTEKPAELDEGKLLGELGA